MHLYAIFEEEDKALKLWKKYDENEKTQMVLPLSVLYFKKRDARTALKCLKALMRANPDVEKFVKAYLQNMIDEYMTDMEGFEYRPFTI